ncbi:MAG TPA: TVP38/TMEM64 family protein [Legionella sp.]|nr:TVP38/TMEM64 family protein [Legionella sp.]
MKLLRWTISIALFLASAYLFQHNLQRILHGVDTAGVFAPILFLILHCFTSVLCLPTVLLVLAGGILFGPVAGCMLNLLGATLGAACGFCISRHLLPGVFRPKENTRMHAWVARVEHQGWKSVALLRFAPVPYNLVNYALGVTRIKFSHFLMATLICLVPNKIVVTYCGYAGIQLFDLIQS